MARKKSLESIEAEIRKTTEEMSKLQDRYDKLGEKLKELIAQRREYVSDEIMDWFEKSGKSLEELHTFLKP